jgi:hypothetical protein
LNYSGINIEIDSALSDSNIKKIKSKPAKPKPAATKQDFKDLINKCETLLDEQETKDQKCVQ